MEVLFVKLLPLVTIGIVLGSAMPSIDIKGPRIVIEYQRLQLECNTNTKHNNLSWYFSPRGPEAQYEPIKHHLYNTVRVKSNGTTVMFRSVNKTHVGSYRCCASEHVCATLSLFVISVTDDHSSLRSTDSDAVNSGELDVPYNRSFSLALYHAPFNGEIYIVREPTVSLCDYFLKHGRECYENRTSGMLSYYVRNGRMQDSGQFNITVTFNQQFNRQELFHLYILIRGGPVVRMNNYNILNNWTHSNLQCHGYAFPRPDITFLYTPCDPMRMDHLHSLQKQDCKESTTIPQDLGRFSASSYHSASFEVIVPSLLIEKGPGIVTCQASNSEGTAEIETFLYVRNFLDPMWFSVVSPTDVVLYGDTVKMSCQVDVYNFTNQFTIQHGVGSLNLVGERFHYAWAVTYRTHITNASQNVISCVAHHKNGTEVRNTLKLSIHYPSAPHIVSVNDTVNITITSGVHIRLECDIDGTPTPDIVWFKNDDHLSNEHGYFIRVSLDPEEIRASYKCVGESRLGKATKTWHIVPEDSMQWLIVSGVGASVLIVFLLIGTIVWAVGAYRQLLYRQYELEMQLNRTDDA